MFEDVAPVRETVEQRGGHLRIMKHLRPLGEFEVGRDHEALAVVVPVGDELEEDLGAVAGQRHEAQLVQNDQRVSLPLPEGSGQGVIVPRRQQIVGQRGDRGEADTEPGVDAADAYGAGQMGFPRSGGTDADDGLPLLQEVGTGKGEHLVFWDGRLRREVEGVQGLRFREVGLRQEHPKAIFSPGDQLRFQQRRQEDTGGLSLGLCVPDQGAPGPRRAGHLEFLEGGVDAHLVGVHPATPARSRSKRVRCVFRSIPATDSGGKPATDSGRSRPPGPVEVGRLIR